MCLALRRWNPTLNHKSKPTGLLLVLPMNPALVWMYSHEMNLEFCTTTIHLHINYMRCKIIAFKTGENVSIENNGGGNYVSPKIMYWRGDTVGTHGHSKRLSPLLSLFVWFPTAVRLSEAHIHPSACTVFGFPPLNTQSIHLASSETKEGFPPHRQALKPQHTPTNIHKL